MNFSDIPIGPTVPLVNTPYIRTMFRRTSEQDGIMEYYDPTNDTMVLQAKVGVHSGHVDIQYQDQNFWKVTVNGRPVGSGEQAKGALTVNPETRTINITT